MRLVVLISGGGSNLQAIMDAIQAKTLNAQIVLVVSNRKNAYGLERAQNANLSTLYFPLKHYLEQGNTREEYDSDLAKRIKPYRPDLVVLAGWMHVLSEAFLVHFPHKVINLHPALYGMFDGINAIERAYTAYRAGEIEFSGCMVHYAIPQVDAGEVILQERVDLHPEDTLETFEARMHTTEHQLIVNAIRKLGGT